MTSRSRRPGSVFYEGFVAEAIADYLVVAEVMDVTGRPNRGLLGSDDLAAWRAGAEPR